MTRPNVFNISAGSEFLPTLVDALLDGKLVEGWSYTSPLDLADVTIFLPTRRAARNLGQVFRQRLGQSVILPSIRPLGDVDEDAGFFLDSAGRDNPLALDPVMPPMRRRLLLAQLILQWKSALKGAVRESFGDEVALPASPADAAYMATDLMSLMDQMETEECDWDNLGNLVPENYSDWWGITLNFLSIATQNWPAILAEEGQMDPAIHRRRVLDQQATDLKKSKPRGPVIAAGSTGSIPATARLLKTISEMPQGAVVLPGLDRHLDAAAWHTIGRLGAIQTSEPGHPQYGLKSLLTDGLNTQNISALKPTVLGVSREDVLSNTLGIDKQNNFIQAREALMSEVMRPAASTESWTAKRDLFPELAKLGLQHIDLIEAPDSHVEALAIATALREAMDVPGQKAALITPDRKLARRVRSALQRFDITADDSAGGTLSDYPSASLAKLTLEFIHGTEEDKRLVLASLLKHPFAALGMPNVEARRLARLIERAVLRGNMTLPVAGDLEHYVDQARERIANDVFAPKEIAQLPDNDWAAMVELVQRLDKAFHVMSKSTDLLSDHARHLAATLEAIAQTDTEPFGTLYSAQGGKELAVLLRSIVEHGDKKTPSVSPSDWPDFFKALSSNVNVRPKAETHPRLFIWGQLESRLLNVDVAVLAGLNEDTWPKTQRNDPFLSRMMKTDLGLEPPERRIGQAAHDFTMAMGAKRVILTRAERVDNAPTVASRWLQRLQTVAGTDANNMMKARGQLYVDFAQDLDKPTKITPCNRPAPKPPLDVRPKKFSFTEVEKLIRDPYALYAKKILNLRPVDSLTSSPSMADQGTLLHGIFADWVKAKNKPDEPDSLTRLLAMGEQHFERLQLPPDMLAFWWPRFAGIAELFLQWETTRQSKVAQSFTEIDGRFPIDAAGEYALIGRADRIDLIEDGSLCVMDYKSGGNPSATQARTFMAPQIVLEAAVAQRGGFETVPRGSISKILLVRLKADKALKVDDVCNPRNKEDRCDAMDLTHRAWEELQKLVAHFNDEDTAYISRTRMEREGDYSDTDHLARVDEWRMGQLNLEGDA